MNKPLRTKSIKTFCTVMVFLTMLIILAPVTAYAAANPVKIPVNQTFNRSDDISFTYILKSLATGNPMPVGSTAEGYLFTIAGTDSVDLGPLSYSEPGLYRYELFQVIGTEQPGYTYDKQVYTIEVYVDENLAVGVIARNEDGDKVGKIEFENRFDALPSDPALMVDPPVRKTVSGNPSYDSTFTFVLAAQDPSFPMPEGSINGKKTLYIVGSGEGEFGTWSYYAAGTYRYTVYEADTGISGYTYDTAVYTITDTVTEENGQLVLSRIVTNNRNESVTTMDFTNRYSGPQSGGKGPKTGDDMNITLYVTLSILGGLLAIGPALYLISNRKRKESGKKA